MKTVAGYFVRKPNEADDEDDEESNTSGNGNSQGLVDNFKRNIGNAWNSLAYGKWRRKEDILEDCNSQIWLLGRCYLPEGQGSSYEENCPLFFQDYNSRIWLTYRRDFPPLIPTNKTTDCGWGCMIRSAQMLVAQALTILFCGRAYRRISKPNIEMLQTIIKLFEDKYDADLSLHRLMTIATTQTDEKAVGQWYSPSRSLALLRDAINNSQHHLLQNIRIYLSADNCIVTSEVEILSCGWTKAIILVVCLRLGTKKINDCYKHHIKSVLSMESSVGLVGGKPKHSVYFVGFHGDYLFDLDPHFAQKYSSLGSSNENDDDQKIWDTFHCQKPTRMAIEEMDPSCAVGFLVKSQQEFNQLIQQLSDSGIIENQSKRALKRTKKSTNEGNSLFSVIDERIPSELMLSEYETPNLADDEDELHGFEVV
uniref:Cysteine protease n=1 Tax=Panagrolaimus sp. PS1159 TaxID=55785 RepID=A0AC35FJQ7_9BILA